MKKITVVLMVLVGLALLSCAEPGKGDNQDAVQNLLNGSWVLTGTDSGKLSDDIRHKLPQLQIDLQNMRMSGYDGCNTFSGSIESVDAKNSVPGNIAVTRKMCMDMVLPDRFHENFRAVRCYTVSKRMLSLTDNRGNVLLTLQKLE